ncbi:MAG: hypothetical protein WDA21_00600 [Bacilli bacterium]
MSTMNQRTWGKYKELFNILKKEARLIKDLEEQAIRDFMAGNFDEQFIFENDEEDNIGKRNIIKLHSKKRKDNILNNFSYKRYCEYMSIMKIINNPVQLETMNAYLNRYKDAYQEAIESHDKEADGYIFDPSKNEISDKTWMEEYREYLYIVGVANNPKKVLFMKKYLERYADSYYKTKRHKDRTKDTTKKDKSSYVYAKRCNCGKAPLNSSETDN